MRLGVAVKKPFRRCRTSGLSNVNTKNRSSGSLRSLFLSWTLPTPCTRPALPAAWFHAFVFSAPLFYTLVSDPPAWLIPVLSRHTQLHRLYDAECDQPQCIGTSAGFTSNPAAVGTWWAGDAVLHPFLDFASQLCAATAGEKKIEIPQHPSIKATHATLILGSCTSPGWAVMDFSVIQGR